jgi:hypothetical protein
MLGKIITIRGIFITILFVTLGFTQVSLEIENVDTDHPSCADSQYTTQSTCEDAATCADSQYTTQSTCEAEEKKWSPKWSTGTLDIYMSNAAGCSYCADSTHNINSQSWTVSKVNCETSGNTTWIAYEQMTEEECGNIPSSDDNGGWWFSGEVAGFQIMLPGVTVTGASGGSAEAAGFFTSVSIAAVLGFSYTGSTIPIGSDVLLTQVSFTTFTGTGICFGEDTGSGGQTAIVQDGGLYVAATWGGCYCVTDSEVDANGNIIGDGVCDTDDNCPAVVNSNQLDTDGDTLGDACDNCPAITNEDQED